MLKIKYILSALCVLCLGVSAKQSNTLLFEQGPYKIFNEQALEVLNLNSHVKTLASGYDWLEGPVWVNQGGYLLYSDIPNHQVYKYTPGKGASLYLAHSGYSNGLIVNKQNELVLLQSRSRVISKMKTPLSTPKPQYLQIVSHYNGQKFNSPNDGVFNDQGMLYFSDPPYGLPNQLDDEGKELKFQGVYSLKNTGELTLLDRDVIYPNGVALSADNKTLYVAASNANKPAWYQYDLNDSGAVVSKSLFYLGVLQQLLP
ncbi:SMP-30/gluconolactonase/LRE family protein [Pseudoalteromonas sp. 31A1]|uniref:SMP-30/gluconolactonase/LRE family protein n=1 Tax=Pseudoalteromonas sp. 31A1 TaxID=2686351 RepID=UPI001F115529|nr:SMP-30/gluconolactonase/LRE family protein [Pseudoalteromonas sp. 31A1]